MKQLISSAILAGGIGAAAISVPVSSAEAAMTTTKSCTTQTYHGQNTRTCTTQKTKVRPTPVYQARPVYHPVYHPPVYHPPVVVIQPAHRAHRW